MLPVLGEAAYTVTPDLPEFGFSNAPGLDGYEYTPELLSHVIDAPPDGLGVSFDRARVAV